MTWVQDGIFAGGGEALPDGWADFSAQTGIRAILHLRPGAPANFRGPTPDSFLWLSVSSEGQAEVADRLLAGAFIADCLAKGERVLLHASLGRHRTRWAYVAYRIWSGAALHAALRQAAQPPWLAPYATDESAWEDLARAVQDHRQELGSTLPLDAR